MDSESLNILLLAPAAARFDELQRSAPAPRYLWTYVRDSDAALHIVARLRFDAVLVYCDDGTRRTILPDLRRASGNTPVLLLVDEYEEDDAEATAAMGAWAYLAWDRLDGYGLRTALQRAAEHRRLNDELERRNSVDQSYARQFRYIIENDVDPAVLLTRDARIYFVNPSAAKLLGQPPDVLIGSESQLPIRLNTTVEATIIRPSGDMVHLEIRALETVWYDVPMFVVFLRDATDRHRLAQENSRLAAAVANLSSGVIITDADPATRHIVFVNRAFTDITGYEADDVIGRDVRFLHGPDTDRRAIEAIERAVTNREPFSGIILNYRKDGTPFWNELTMNAVYDDAGSLINYVALQNDVTERMAAEDALRHTNERLKILRDIDRAILSYDPLETIALAALGNLRKLIACERASIILIDPVTESASILATHHDAATRLGTGTPLPLDEIDVTGDLRAGKVRRINDVRQYEDASSVAARLYEEGIRSYIAVPMIVQGTLMGILNLGANREAAFTDADVELAREVVVPFAVAVSQAQLTRQIQDYATQLEWRVEVRTEELRRTEEELRAALLKEQQLNELKTRFATMVSHEFRVPLATIRASSDIIKKYYNRLTDERRLNTVESIQSQVVRLTELLEDILTISQAETVGLPFNPTVFEVEPFCREVVDEVRQATNHSHHLALTLEGECNQVQMDRKLVRQLLANLLTNAIKYSPPTKTVYIDVRCADDRTVIQVADQGIGIPEADQAHLYEMFHRSTNVGTAPGSGLGLAIAKHAVDMHNGTIHLESRVGVGTTVTVRLPSFPASTEASV